MEDETCFRVLLCGTCGIGATHPVPARQVRDALYAPGDFRASDGTRFHGPLERLVTLSRRMRRRRIEGYRRNGRILDVGCGRGLFLSLMRQAGWDVAGVEYDEETASCARDAFGIPVVSGDPDHWPFMERAFDAVTLYHVLEHVQDPRAMIERCCRLLKRGGLLVISVPNLSSLQARFGKGDWFHLDLPRHLYHFQADGLIRLLKERSLEILYCRRFDLEYDPFGWLQTLLNRIFPRRNSLFCFLRSGPSPLRGYPGAYWNLAAHILLLPILAPFSLVLSLLDSVVYSNGGTIEVYARVK